MPTSNPIGSMNASSLGNLHKISPPPKFEPQRFDVWPREMKFWRNLYRSLPDEQLLAAIGLSGNTDFRDLLMDYYESCNGNYANASFSDFMDKEKQEYGALAEVNKMEKLQEIMAFKSKNEWDIRQYGRKFRAIRNRGKDAGVAIPPDIEFTHVLQSMELTNSRRRLILAHYEASKGTKTSKRYRIYQYDYSEPTASRGTTPLYRKNAEKRKWATLK